MCKIINLQEHIRQQNRIIVRGTYPEINGNKVISVSLEKMNNGNPGAIVMADGKEYDFELINGFQVHRFNTFLRSLNLGLDIEFNTYSQYGLLLMKCNELIHKRNSKNQVITL